MRFGYIAVMQMDIKSRKKNRLENYDYSESGAYFITICTKDRKRILSNIIVGTGETLLLGEMSQGDKEVMAKP